MEERGRAFPDPMLWEAYDVLKLPWLNGTNSAVDFAYSLKSWRRDRSARHSSRTGPGRDINGNPYCGPGMIEFAIMGAGAQMTQRPQMHANAGALTHLFSSCENIAFMFHGGVF